jgi:hypothetical protein
MMETCSLKKKVFNFVPGSGYPYLDDRGNGFLSILKSNGGEAQERWKREK